MSASRPPPTTALTSTTAGGKVPGLTDGALVGAVPSGVTWFPAIDALRAVAALLVLWYHVIELGNWAEFPWDGPLRLAREGWIGVDLFFVISGFVIGLSALRGFATQGARFRRHFSERRLARIVPLYALTALLFLLLVEPSPLALPLSTLATHIGVHALFLHNLHPATHGSINGPNWSVALEMQFYLLMAFIAPWLSRRHWLVVIGAGVGVAWTWRAGVVAVIGPGVDRAHLLHVYSTQLPGTLDAFAMGGALSVLVAGGSELGAGRLLRPGWGAFAGWACAFAALAWVTMEFYWPRGPYWDRWEMIVFWRSALSATFAAFVGAAIVLPARGVRWLRPMRYLGEVSYGIYLWHLPVLLTLLALPSSKAEVLLLRVGLGTLVLASFSWHFFERGFIVRARRPGR